MSGGCAPSSKLIRESNTVDKIKSSHLVEEIYQYYPSKSGCTLGLLGKVKNNIDFWLFAIK